MIPFYIFYSMFGFQRIGDLAWAAGDMRARGFLLGGTAGRTTLNGEGLQHEDGHSHLLAATIPNCVAYDPTFGYEVAVIVQDGLRRMLAEQEDVFYYLTLMNENYAHPADARGRARRASCAGMYQLAEAEPSEGAPRVQLLGSGTILREVLAAAELLREDWGVSADVWSVTSFTELRREGLEVERWNLLHPDEEPRRAWVAEHLDGADGPGRRGHRLHARVRRPDPAVGARAATGARAPTASAAATTARRCGAFFEVDRHHVALAALTSLAAEGEVDAAMPAQGDPRIRHRPRAAGAVAGVREAPWRRSERSSFPTSATSPTCRSSRCSCRRATRVAPEDPLVTLESDKATMDVPAPFGGMVAEMQGQRGRHGLGGLADPHARRSGANGAPAGGRPRPSRPAPAPRSRSAAAERRPSAPASPQAAPTVGEDGAPPYASPAVRRLARELGVT